MSNSAAGTVARMAVPLFLLLPAACTNLGSYADILASAGGVYGGGLGGDRSGQINSVDTRRQEIQLSSNWGGSEWLRYDNRTQVTYGSRRSSVNDLRRGDHVRVSVDSDRRGVAYARRIQIQESGRLGGVGQGSQRVQRITGEVGRIDSQRGTFELYENRNSAILVMLPYQPSRAIRDRFQRLRRGNRVSIEGQILSGNRMELVRFR